MIEVGSTVRYTGLQEAFHQERAGFGLVTDVIAVGDGDKLALVQFKKIGCKVKIMVGDTLEEVDVQQEGVIHEITDKVFDDAVHKALQESIEDFTAGLEDDNVDFEKLNLIGMGIAIFGINLRKELFGEADGD